MPDRMPSCPICGANHWRAIGERTYRIADVDRLNEYVRVRYRILFEKWFPARDEVTLTSRLCRDCGFITYTPRPDAADIEAKYNFLGGTHQPVGTAPERESTMEHRRGRRLLRRLQGKIPIDGKTRILDFGGGDGRLMRAFAARGADCSLIDYSERTAPWVTRLGATERDLAPDERFDVIVCCHVIEHVADPVGILATLSGHLSDDGLLYVEVPMEVWGRAPLHEEPVTHVNFFTPASLARCLHEAGIGRMFCRLDGCLHPRGQTLLAVVALGGRRGTASAVPSASHALAEAQGFLAPGYREKFRRYMAVPSGIPAAFGYKAKLLLRRRGSRAR